MIQKDVASREITIGGTKRSYLLYNPKAKGDSPQKKALLFLLHGRFGTGQQIMEQSNMNSIADREGFVVVYPNGYDRSWADGRGKTPADKQDIDDVLFIKSIFEDVTKDSLIDKNRIFVAGHSNGGFMTQKLLLSLSTIFKAGVSIAAQLSANVVKQYSFANPVSVSFISGTDDPLVPYYGGYVKDGGEILSVEDSVERWRIWNQCSNFYTRESQDNKPDKTSIERITYLDCKQQTKVMLVNVIGGGHSYPGKDQKIPLVKMGNPTEEIDASEEIWNFFKDIK
ncbi:MAG: prolyl oligopeptidase family serine peptidase [Leptospira sp.]|nr:prolyl oligopeptidase family serine peptidase [Leptospira sp.]